MKVRHTTSSGQDKIELQMTPMIDIVFQLLVFFIMTFKIVSQEGDFNIKMPLHAPATGTIDQNEMLTVKIRMTADADGNLDSLLLGNREIVPDATGDNRMEKLRNEIVAIVGDDQGPSADEEQGPEVELDCDYDLDYVHVINVITAVSGYLGPNQEVIKLIQKIKFAPPRNS